MFTVATSCLRPISSSVWISRLNHVFLKHLCLSGCRWGSVFHPPFVYLFRLSLCKFVYEGISVCCKKRRCSMSPWLPSRLDSSHVSTSLLTARLGLHSSFYLSSTFSLSPSQTCLPLCLPSLFILSFLHPSGRPPKCIDQLVVVQEENGNRDPVKHGRMIQKMKKTHRKRIMLYFSFAQTNVFAITLCKQRINGCTLVV